MTKFFRISSLIAAFAMSLTSVLNAAQVYLDAPNPYTQGNEVWYAWTWGEGNNGTWAPATDEGDGLLSFDVPEGNIIFVRMNSSAAGNPSWGAKWNQTDDLTVVDEGTYTITGWGEGDNPKMTGYWTDPDPNNQYTLKPVLTPAKRTALAGRNCMVNKLVNVVEAGSWINDLDNMVDEDLENYAEFPSIASVGVGVKPITSIRDVKHHYAAGTTAGFNLIADAGSLLNLNVASVYSIAFYLEGELQQTVAVSSGQTVNGIGLSLINIPSTDNACFDVIATAPCEFDEIALMPAGVNAQVGTSTKIKYAFVGDYSFNTITSNTENGMPVYAPAHNRQPFTLDAYPSGSGGAKIVDADLTNGWSWGVISVGVSMDAKAISQFDRTDPDQSQCFKKGSTVGFLFSNSSLLKLPVGNGIVIRLYKGEWVEKERLITHEKYWEWEETEVQSENVGGSILELNVISGSDQYVSIIAKDDFSTVRFTTPTGLTLDLGFLQVKYAYVSDPTEVGHECNLKLSADNAITNKDNEYQLTEGGGIPVTWTIVSQPDGANAQVDANGLVTGMTVDGEYVIRGTAEDGCYDEVTITRGIESSYTADLCDEVIQNEGAEETYVLSEVSDGSSLIKINEQLDDPENVLTSPLEDYAIYANVLNATVVSEIPIVGVKKTDGLMSDGNVRRIGFVVEAQSTGLDLNVVNLFSIRTYKNGQQTYSSLISENNAISVKLIGSNKAQKLRFAITVPADVEFDEFVLWKTGVLNVNIDKFKIYYSFNEAVSEENEPTPCYDPLGCEDAILVSDSNNARIDGNDMQFAGGVQVGTVVDNLTYLVDDDPNSSVSITNSVSLGDGLVVAIDLGHVYGPNQQVGIITDSKTYVAGVNAGNWVTITTWLDGVEQESQSDWSVLGVNAIGYGDKSYIFMNTTKPYDKITITIASVASLLNVDSEYYGVFIRNDYDGDGIPNCMDEDSLSDELTLDEEATVLEKSQDYEAATLVLHRTFFGDTWDCIVLPVDLTWLQVRNAFGNNVELGVPEAYYIWESGDQRATVIYYEQLTPNEGDLAIEAGKCYIIKTSREPDITEGTYTTRDGVTLNAPIYFISGVNYTRSIAEQPVEPVTVNYKALSLQNNQAPALKGDEVEENIVLRGSMVALDGTVNPKVEANNYVYDTNNKLRKLNTDEEMLGFRFYAENNTDYNLIQEADPVNPTGIAWVVADKVIKNGVYTIDGRMVRSDNNINGLPAGFYIVGGKKVVIK